MTFKDWQQGISNNKKEWYVYHFRSYKSNLIITRYLNDSKIKIHDKPLTLIEARNFRDTIIKLRGK